MLLKLEKENHLLYSLLKSVVIWFYCSNVQDIWKTKKKHMWFVKKL